MKKCILACVIVAYLAATSKAQLIESFDKTGEDNTVFFRADAIYSADGVKPSGGNRFGNEPFCNGFVVASTDKFGPINNDQSGTGNYLWNGTLSSAAPDYSGLVWGNLAPVNVEVNTNYVFSFYLTNSNENGAGPAIIQPFANGQSLADGVSAVGSFGDGQDSMWQRFEFNWLSQDQTEVLFELRNLLVPGNGNDFGIDTIELARVGDISCDGETNLLDVAPFVDVLTGGELTIKADINQDGEVDLLDVAPFVDLLTGG